MLKRKNVNLTPGVLALPSTPGFGNGFKLIMDKATKNLIESVLSLPTMTFNETAVSTFIKWYAAGLDLDVSEDMAGNVIVNYSGGSKSGITFSAHMDHPGFEIIQAKGMDGTAALWGRVDVKFFSGSKVIVHTADGPCKATIGKLLTGKSSNGKPCFQIKAKSEMSKGDFGHYDIPYIKFSDDRISALAADNLMGVSSILELMTRLVAKKAKVNVTGFFTRAEEAGFLGAFAAMESESVSKKNPLIVMECSSAPGGKVDIGGGPVIRSGDAQSSYNPEVEAWLIASANMVLKKNKKFKHQRALLKGGRCEACVYISEEYLVGGIALPLGNYHNHGPKSYAPEYISANDYSDMILLMEELAKSPMPKDFLKSKVDPIWKNYHKLKKKLIESK
ncbi:MAG: M28 family peptidase [Deltaproteobacteria bacterium]|nr:M28 family peptidase [Deltaproteobacteria bacterium]